MNNSFSSLSIMKDGSLVDETAEQELSVRTHQALINLGKALHEHPSDSETQVQKCLAEAQTVLRRVDTSRRQAQKLLRISHKKSCDLLREKTVSQSFANDCRSQLLQTQQKLRDVHQRCDQYEKAFETTTVELMKLRRFVRALPSNYVACGMAYLENDPSEEFGEMPQMSGAGAQQLVPDRRFEEAFRDKMRGIYFHRRYRHARRLHEESCRRYEEMCMELEDGGISCGLGSRLSITPASAPPTEEAKATSPLAAQSQFPLLMDIPCKISFSSTTPDDDVLKSLIYHSNFGDVLSDSRDGLLQLSNRMKSAQDTAVRNLYEVFMSALRTIAAVFDDEGGKVKKYLQKSFETQVVKMQGAHRDNLISLVRQTNDTTRNIVRVEKLLLASGKLPAVVAVPATVAAENGGVASQPATPRPASPRGSKHLDELLHIHRELQMKSEANSVKLNITHENAAALLGHLKRVTDTISELKVSGAVAKSAWPFTSAEEAAVDLPGLGNRMSAAVDLVVASMRHAFRSMDDGSLSLSASIRPHSPKRGRKGSTGRPKLVASPPRRKSQAAASPTAGGPPRDKQRLSGAPPLKLRELSLSASTSMGATTDALMTEDSVTELMPGDVVMQSAEEHSTEQEPLTPDEILLNDSTNNLTAPRRKKADRRVRSNSLQAHKVFQPSWRHALSPTKLRRGSERDGGIPRPPPPLPPATVTTGVLSSEASLPSSWSCSPSFSSIPSFFSLPTAVRNRSVPTHVPTASEPRTPVGIVGVSLSVDRSR